MDSLRDQETCRIDAVEAFRKTSHCLHCQQPLASVDRTDDFCCNGCQAAYQLIHSQGLDQYYAIRDRMSGIGSGSNASTSNDIGLASNATLAVPEQLLRESFVDLDAPRFWQQHVISLPEGRVQATLRLHGIHCAACVWLLERLPQFQPGVIYARVDLTHNSLELVWNPAQVQLSQIARRIARLGYRASPINSTSRKLVQQQDDRKQLIQIGIAAACSANIMLAAFAIYAGQWTGMAAEHLQLLRWVSTGIGLVSLLGPGSVFFRGAWAAIQTQTPHMDLPVAIGLGVGAVSGAWNTIAGEGELFFDSLSMLVFFLLVGRAIQSRQQRAACEAVDLLSQLTPATANRVNSDGSIESIAVELIEKNDVLEVHAGATIPADGTMIEGTTDIDTSLLTGESLTTTATVGTALIAGTLNCSRTIRMRSERTGSETRLGKLVSRIESASLQKTKIVQWADKISGTFVVTVIALAIVVGAAWFFIDRSVMVDRVIALLIVACPCALGLATPLAIAVGLGRSAQSGVLIKGGDTLQRLSQPGTLVFDKTGTLTEGKLQVLHWYGPYELLSAGVALESHCQHPVAEALKRYANELAKRDNVPPPPSSPVHFTRQHFGQGISGNINDDSIAVGNLRLMKELAISIDEDLQRQYNDCLIAGNSPLLFAMNGRARGLAALGDRIRPEAKQVLDRLRSKGWGIGILSGDHPEIVSRVATELNIAPTSTWGGASPEEKLQHINDLKKNGKPVMMVGDGVNDAAALASADVGIAIRGGAEVSLQAADVFLASGSLVGIEQVLETSRRTMWVIGRNSIASLLYNFTAVSLASIGWLHPLAAALLMPASSLTVISVTIWGHWRKQIAK